MINNGQRVEYFKCLYRMVQLTLKVQKDKFIIFKKNFAT